MSGESTAVIGVVGLFAAGAFVAARLATGATGLLGSALTGIGDRSDVAYARWEQEHCAAVRWEAAAREVVRRNARIAVLAARAAQAPEILRYLPEPVEPAGREVEDLIAWTGIADSALDRAEAALGRIVAGATVAALRAAVAAGSPSGGPVRIGPDEVRKHYAAALAAAREHPEPRAAGTVEAVGDAERILARLEPAVPEPERAEVLAVAAAVGTRRGADRLSQLEELRRRVAAANATAASRLEHSLAAAVRLQALDGADEPELRARLADVVAGRAEATAELEAQVSAACERVRARAEADYVRERTLLALAELGYRPETDASTFTGRSGALRVTPPGWSEHAVGVAVAAGEIRTSVVRLVARDGDDARRADAECEEQWCSSFEQLRDELGEAGVDARVTRLVPPGGRTLPVVARRDREQTRDAPAARRREVR